MATPQNADLSLINLTIKDNLLCRGTIVTNEIKGIQAEFDFLHVRNRAILPPVPPVPTPTPPNPHGSLTVDGDLTVDGTSTLVGSVTMGGTLDVTGTTTISSLNVTGNETVNGDLTVIGQPYIGPIPTTNQLVYVSKGGNDTKGDGRILTPFLTIQRAMTSITDASQTKMYAVILGPGRFSDDFAFKPWVSVSGEPSTSAFQGVSTISAATITFDPSWLGTTYDVAWFTHLTFDDLIPYDIQNVNAQLTFFDCTFNSGASFTGHHSGNVNNITWDTCLSYGTVSVTDCQFFFLVGGTSILASGPVTITATSAVGAGTPTQLLALSSSISSTANPGLVFVSGAGSGGAKGDMRGCSVETPLSLSGAGCSYTSTVEGFPQTVTFSGGASVTNLHYYTFSNALAYTPTNLANWSGTSPVTVQNALDRIAAKITPIP